MKYSNNPAIAAKELLAAKLVRFLGTAESVEEYVGEVPTPHHPGGYRFKKITLRKEQEGDHHDL